MIDIDPFIWQQASVFLSVLFKGSKCSGLWCKCVLDWINGYYSWLGVQHNKHLISLLKGFPDGLQIAAVVQDTIRKLQDCSCTGQTVRWTVMCMKQVRAVTFVSIPSCNTRSTSAPESQGCVLPLVLVHLQFHNGPETWVYGYVSECKTNFGEQKEVVGS